MVIEMLAGSLRDLLSAILIRVLRQGLQVETDSNIIIHRHAAYHGDTGNPFQWGEFF